ncbi:MAG: hypothetical protein ACYC25_17285, partial [Paludibacter sp.]
MKLVLRRNARTDVFFRNSEDTVSICERAMNKLFNVPSHADHVVVTIRKKNPRQANYFKIKIYNAGCINVNGTIVKDNISYWIHPLLQIFLENNKICRPLYATYSTEPDPFWVHFQPAFKV